MFSSVNMLAHAYFAPWYCILRMNPFSFYSSFYVWFFAVVRYLFISLITLVLFFLFSTFISSAFTCKNCSCSFATVFHVLSVTVNNCISQSGLCSVDVHYMFLYLKKHCLPRSAMLTSLAHFGALIRSLIQSLALKHIGKWFMTMNWMSQKVNALPKDWRTNQPIN